MTDHEKFRRAVSKAYGKAVCESKTGPGPKGCAAGRAGYSEEELRRIPSEAKTNSFGCGNPLAFSNVREGEVVLDLGSGAGIDLLMAAKKVGPTGRVIGVDMTPEMLDKARWIIAESGFDNVEVREGLIEDLPLDSASADWIISNCVINLSPEKNRVFKEIARVLKPGGRMLVSDIVADNLPQEVKSSLDLYCSCIAGAISEEEYRKGLLEAGLVDIEIQDALEYESSLLEGILKSDQEAGGCCKAETGSIKGLAHALSGKVRSARIFARKPN